MLSWSLSHRPKGATPTLSWFAVHILCMTCTERFGAQYTRVYVGPILADARISGLAKRLLAICTYSELAQRGCSHSKRGICRSRGPGLQHKETASANGGWSLEGLLANLPH